MAEEDSVIADTVYGVIKELLGDRRSSFSLGDRLVRDLKIESDDLSFYFVPELERRLSVRVPVKEWATVYTGLDACVLLAKYRAHK